ncbi:MAG: phosphatidylglycerophosphatase A [Gammaproteobacteria bacterium]|tara:strand:- start:708 stop:1211 length:504 start_codon:yes stop_codon:yes gene_type:complete
MHNFPQLQRPSHLLATLFGVGLLPFAPGTWGSIAGLLVYMYLVVYLSLGAQTIISLTAVIAVFSIWICHLATKDLERADRDQKSIVIDELAGLWIALLPIAGLLMIKEVLVYGFLAFVLFRIFDIWKPFPISLIDKNMKNGLGVVLDDLIAGVYAAFFVSLFLFLFS